MLGEDPRLWTWTVVKISNMEDFQKVNIRKLSMLQEIKVPHQCDHARPWNDVECNWMEEANELFKVIVKIPTGRPVRRRDKFLAFLWSLRMHQG